MNFIQNASIETLSLIHWIVVFPAILLGTWLIARRNVSQAPFGLVCMGSFILFIYVQAINVYEEEISSGEFLWAIWVVPFLLLIGYALAYFPTRLENISHFHSANSVSTRDQWLAVILPIITIAVICLPVIFILDVGVQSVSLFFAIANPGNPAEAMSLRIGGLESRIGPVLTLVYSYSRSLLLPIYAAIMATFWSRRLVSTLHFLAGVPVAIFFAMLTAEKAPAAVIVLAGGVGVYLSSSGKGKAKGIQLGILIGLLGLLVPSLIYPLLQGKSGAEGASYALEMLWRRITWVPSYTAALYYEAFGNTIPFLGSSSNRFLAYLAGETPRHAAALVNSDYLRATEGGLVNAPFFASFYADWGMPGTIVGSLLVGIICGCLQSFFERQRQDLSTTAIRAVVLLGTAQLMLSNFYATAFGRGFLSVPLLFFVYDLLGQRRPTSPQLAKNSQMC